jgi:hypothetical protein
LRIEAYFQQLQAFIDGCPVVDSQTVGFDKRGSYLGFIRGDLIMSDGSLLHFREFVDTEYEIDRKIYAYQYMDSHRQIIFRYDNSDHHQHLQLPTHPTTNTMAVKRPFYHHPAPP